MAAVSESDASGKDEQVEQFSRLLVANQRRLYGFILSLVHDRAAANDILQEVSAVIWRKFERFEPGTDFAAWAMSVARLSIFEWRRAQKNVPLPLDDDQFTRLADEVVAVSCEFEARREALAKCVRTLAASDRELLLARYFQDDPVTRIAGRLNQSRMAIYKRLNRIHRALLDCIQTRIASEGSQ